MRREDQLLEGIAKGVVGGLGTKGLAQRDDGNNAAASGINTEASDVVNQHIQNAVVIGRLVVRGVDAHVSIHLRVPIGALDAKAAGIKLAPNVVLKENVGDGEVGAQGAAPEEHDVHATLGVGGAVEFDLGVPAGSRFVCAGLAHCAKHTRKDVGIGVRGEIHIQRWDSKGIGAAVFAVAAVLDKLQRNRH